VTPSLQLMSSPLFIRGEEFWEEGGKRTGEEGEEPVEEELKKVGGTYLVEFPKMEICAL
jgi:hypothetical protein